jgi:hypothetical protein
MRDDLHPTRIAGTIELSDGSTTEFAITPVGWQQWGNIAEKLGPTVDLMEAFTEAASEHGLAEVEEDEEG